MIQIRCSNCGTVNERDETPAEGELRCSACQSELKGDSASQAPRQRKFLGSRQSTWILTLAAAAIVVVMLGFGFFGWEGDDSAANQPKQIKVDKDRVLPKTGHSAIQ